MAIAGLAPGRVGTAFGWIGLAQAWYQLDQAIAARDTTPIPERIDYGLLLNYGYRP
jgi:hypothetical protein